MSLPDKVYHRNQTDEWETPPKFFAVLDEEFKFTVDAAASVDNHKCPRYWTMADDGLAQSWAGETVWCNPPYSQVAKWLRKAALEARYPHTTIVMLTGARVGTRYWHEWVFPCADEIRFLLGRLRFLNNGEMSDACPFDLAVIVYKYGSVRGRITSWDWKGGKLP